MAETEGFSLLFPHFFLTPPSFIADCCMKPRRKQNSHPHVNGSCEGSARAVQLFLSCNRAGAELSPVLAQLVSTRSTLLT